MIETEVKIRVESFGSLRAKLKSIGAKKISSVFERNRVFDAANGELKKKDCLLRVRTGKKATMCFKGPREKNNCKSRKEIEFAVDDAEKAAAFLEALGFVQKLRYEKRRETWLYKKTEIVLDELPFGCFVEIEGAEKDIDSVACAVGFCKGDYITKTYFELAEDVGIKGDIAFGDDKNG